MRRAAQLACVTATIWVFMSSGGARAAELTSYVNPFSGTAAGAADFGTGGGAGNTYPGAVAPFGMVSWSPETIPDTVNFAAGYSYSDRQLDGFSLTHLSGAGCAAAQDIPFLPTTARVTSSPAQFGSSNVDPRYLASFSHADEHAASGYYQVELNSGTADTSKARGAQLLVVVNRSSDEDDGGIGGK